MGLYQLARRVNARRKAFLKQYAGTVLSPVRRIERVQLPKGQRVCAMTFDDGPDALEVSGTAKGLTATILDALREYNARVTFDVIGSTAGNYPDEKGADGTFLWSGCAYDHYPKFGADDLAGAKNRPELVRSILAAGHEISNHGSTHTLFGKMRAVYGKRTHFTNLSEVVDDLDDLHSYMEREFNYTMRLARPAHYIDRIPDGATAYDAYRVMGYNYMAASFDGAGWLPLPSYEDEVKAMTEPLRLALEKDPDSLSGQIIFQKDGCNMSHRTPIADALPQQLRLLRDYGYTVVPVSELMDMSPFEDVCLAGDVLDACRYLAGRGHIVGYKNNTFHPERYLTEDEFYLMLAPAEVLRAPVRMTRRDLSAAAKKACPVEIKNASANAILAAAEKLGAEVDIDRFKDKKALRRDEAAVLISGIVRALEE